MSCKCICINPQGGGTTCPEQYVAVCMRGHDGECHGECISIPTKYSSRTQDFKNWLDENLESTVVSLFSADREEIRLVESTRPSDRIWPEAGQMGFKVYLTGWGKVTLMYSYQFRLPLAIDDSTRYWRATLEQQPDGRGNRLWVQAQVKSGIVQPTLTQVFIENSERDQIVIQLNHVGVGPYSTVTQAFRISGLQYTTVLIVDQRAQVIARIPIENTEP